MKSKRGSRVEARRLAKLDQGYVWHPFTQMRDWARQEPIVIVEGRGVRLWDARGREYLDANSSIWTNLHGHRNERIDRALKVQLGKVAHTSALGLANEPAALLAKRLVDAAAVGRAGAKRLAKVFFSDDGSTAMEVALKQSYEFARRARGLAKPKFLSLEGAYHGDTIGAVSVGHIDLFHKAYSGMLFGAGKVMAPYCYRCPFNRAARERVDARVSRKCGWECVDQVEAELMKRRKKGEGYAAMVIEPGMQGAAGMIPQPEGWLKRVAGLLRARGVQLIADEVMTGFGRGVSLDPDADLEVGARRGKVPLFASLSEGVRPDFLVLAKGLTGGYLPMAATLTHHEVFDAFLGEYEEFKTFFHGHSFTGNQLGAAAALASLDLLEAGVGLERRRRLEGWMRRGLETLWDLPWVGDVRQVGLVAGVELVRDWRTGAPFELADRVGIRVCGAMARRGVLTRPIGNVLVLMPPFVTKRAEWNRMVEVLRDSVLEVLGDGKL